MKKHQFLKVLAIAGSLSIALCTFSAFAQNPNEPAAQQVPDALGELQIDGGYERRETDSGTGASAATSRRIRFSAQQYYLYQLPWEDSGAFGIGIGARTERSHWSPVNSEQIDLSAHIGWMLRSWFVSIGYIFFAHEKNTSSGVETQNSSGSGITASACYYFWWNSFGFGPSLTFDSIKYAATQAGTLPEVAAVQTRETLRPGFAISFRF